MKTPASHAWLVATHIPVSQLLLAWANDVSDGDPQVRSPGARPGGVHIRGLDR